MCNGNVLTSQYNNSNINLKDEVLKMTTTLQIRIDEELKQQATKVYDTLGMDLSTAIRIFLKRSVAINGMPFNLVIDDVGLKAMQSMDNMAKAAKEKGISDMTMEEIDEIISDTRKRKRAKWSYMQ